MLNIEDRQTWRFSFLHLGFRPFFLLGGLFALVAMLLWTWFYQAGYTPASFKQLNTITWHAHEIIYGYTLAVIAGFLLTAVRNWTGVQTVNGIPLFILVSMWLLARLMPFVPVDSALQWMMFFDLAFNVGLSIGILHPVVKARQWSQVGIWLNASLFTVSHILFYLGLNGNLEKGVTWGLYAGLYLALFLILVMARRVVPFFIEKGLAGQFVPRNNNGVDISILVLLACFIINEVFVSQALLAFVVSISLVLLHGWRLASWYTHAIWKKPLLWILVLAYTWIVAGFVMKAFSYFIPVNSLLILHAFGFGAVGLMTMGMMCRVALGHTGRDVFNPPAILNVLFILLATGSIVRVILPLLFEQYYGLWIGISQVLWICSYLVFVFIYTPVLYKPRIDGRYG